MKNITKAILPDPPQPVEQTEEKPKSNVTKFQAVESLIVLPDLPKDVAAGCRSIIEYALSLEGTVSTSYMIVNRCANECKRVLNAAGLDYPQPESLIKEYTPTHKPEKELVVTDEAKERIESGNPTAEDLEVMSETEKEAVEKAKIVRKRRGRPKKEDS